MKVLLSPSPTRWKDRSRTYPGIASAMADQWGTGNLPPVARQLSLFDVMNIPVDRSLWHAGM